MSIMIIRSCIFPLSFFAIAFLYSCNDDDVPVAEPDEEIISSVRLIFSPVEGGSPIVAKASDPDGEGVNDLEPEENIELDINTSYQLFIEMENSLTGENVGDEIEEEGDEHMIFFGFTEGLFQYPTGDGNIDGRASQTVEYLDEDATGLPIGLITAWVTGEESNGTFRIMLKHQPGVKSETSTSSVGATDLDVTWAMVVD